MYNPDITLEQELEWGRTIQDYLSCENPTLEQEKAYTDARYALYFQYEDMVKSLVKREFNISQVKFAVDKEDVIQELNVKLWLSTNDYDPSKGTKFSTLIYLRLMKEIDVVRTNQRPIKLGVYANGKLSVHNDAVDKYNAEEHGNFQEYIRSKSKLTYESYNAIVSSFTRMTSLQSPVVKDGQETEIIQNTIVDPNDKPVESRMMIDEIVEDLRKHLTESELLTLESSLNKTMEDDGPESSYKTRLNKVFTKIQKLSREGKIKNAIN